MARIAGINLPTGKRVEVGLQYIHGIGQKRAKDIMAALKSPTERRVNQLTDNEVSQIREMIDREYQVEADIERALQERVSVGG